MKEKKDIITSEEGSEVTFSENTEGVEQEKEEVSFSVGAFIFNFLYFYYKGFWKAGIALEILCVVCPLKAYFFFGLIVGFCVNSENSRNKSKVVGLLLGILGLVSFIILKLFRFKYFGSY